MKNQSNEKGITLISLVVTVIVLLIIAGISIGTLTGDSGLISNAKNAKERSVIDNEIEMIKVSTAQAMNRSDYGMVTVENFKNALDKNIGAGKYDIKNESNGFKVTIKETEYSYFVDEDGVVNENYDQKVKKFVVLSKI